MFTKETAFQLLYTSDIDKTVNAYSAIGATISTKEWHKMVCELGDYELHFCLDSAETVPVYKEFALQPDRGKGIIFYVGVENLEEMYTKAQHAPGKILNEIAVQPWSCREFLWQDPNGYMFAFYHEI